MLRVHSGPSYTQVEEATFFAFDDICIPFRKNFQLHLIHGKRTPGWRTGPTIVVPAGEPGSHDEQVHYYGSTVRVGDEFRMWYIGRVGERAELVGGYQGYDGRLCYAVSRDGVHWEKPELGLVEYQGSKANNLVDFPQDLDIPMALIIFDPEDPDPERQFKITFSHRTGPSGERRGGLSVASGVSSIARYMGRWPRSMPARPRYTGPPKKRMKSVACSTVPNRSAPLVTRCGWSSHS